MDTGSRICDCGTSKEVIEVADDCLDVQTISELLLPGVGEGGKFGIVWDL